MNLLQRLHYFEMMHIKPTFAASNRGACCQQHKKRLRLYPVQQL